MMLERIKKMVFASYDSKQPRGVFFSLFDQDSMLLDSHGVIQSDKTLGHTLDTLYHGLIEKKLPEQPLLIVDVVTSLQEKVTSQDIMAINLQNEGLFIAAVQGNKSATMLPGTAGVTDVPMALSLLQKKFAIDGNVRVYAFVTEKFSIT